MKDRRPKLVQDNEECIKTRQVHGKWYIKQRKGKYILTER